MAGIAVSLTGFGNWNDKAYYDVANKIATILGKHVTNYPMSSFLSVGNDSLHAINPKTHAEIMNAATKMVELPPLSEFVKKWEVILQELSADLEGTIVCILVNGTMQAAIGGNIL